MTFNRATARVFVFLWAATFAICAVEHADVARAQETQKTVDDGVFTEAQAIRGSVAYDASCSQCHRADLSGADGPALRDARFAKNFAGQDLKTLYTKIATTMPRGAPGSLGNDVYFDIVAHVLRENGFPPGTHELTEDALGVRVLPGRAKPPPPVGDFSYVEVIGCLVPGPDNTWLLTNATEPASVVIPAGSTPKQPDDAAARVLGSQTFHLLDARAYGPDAFKGHKMYVRGLLIKLPSEQRMTISSFETLASSCVN